MERQHSLTFFDKKIEKFINTFLTASFLARDTLVSARKFDKKKIEVINNCIISEGIGMDRNQIFTELSFSKETFVLTQVGFLTEGTSIFNRCSLFTFQTKKGVNTTDKITFNRRWGG